MGDESLYTGMSSKSFNPTPQKAVEDKKQAKRETKAILQPSQALLLDIITKEKKRTCMVSTFPTTPEAAQNHFHETMGRAQYQKFLTGLEALITNTMKEVK